MKNTLLAGLVVLAATTGALAGETKYSTTASMNFFEFSPIPFPSTAGIMGERDLNYLILSGEPFGFFELYGVDNNPPQNRRLRRIPIETITGQFDINGQAQIQLPFETVQDQTNFTLNATIDNGTSTPSQLTADIFAFRAMAGFIELEMAAGSLAHSRGCLMGLDIAAQRLWIGNIEYALTPKTDFANFIALEELVVGKTWLNVNGDYDGVGGFIANEVGLEDMQPYTRLEGRVQGMGPSGVVIMNVAAYISPETIIYDHDTGKARTFSDVEPFMPIEIWIDTNNTMYPHIVQMAIDTPIEPEPEPEPETENESEDPPPSYCG